MPKKPYKFVIVISTLVVLGAIGAIGAVTWQSGESEHSHSTTDSQASSGSLTSLGSKKKSAEDSGPNAISQSVPVRVFQVGSVESQQTLSGLTGVVRARHEINIAFRVSGKIQQRLVEVGQAVGKGELLFELDSEDFAIQQRTAQANLDVAEASLRRATQDEKRASVLKKSNAISDSEYEESLSDRDIEIGQHQSAQKQLELANNQLSYCRVSADESGVITSIDAEAGQVVAAGFRIAAMAQSDEFEAVVDIPENRLPKDQNLKPIVRFWSLPNVTVLAKLREISPVADPLTRTFRSRFTLIDPPRDIKLGMTATVEWSNAANINEVSIPASAIFQRDGQPAVWLVDTQHGTINATPIKIALVGDREVKVSAGLTNGQTIVSAGVQKLDEGVRVRVWENLP